MTTPTPRRFRFHLLTLVLMALTAGLIIWPNVVPNPRFQYACHQSKSMFGDFYGWPAAFALQDHSENFAMTTDGRCLPLEGPAIPMKLTWIPGLLIDGLVFIGVLALIALISESILRRRGRGREGQ